MKFHDYYKTLGVARDASEDEIKRAYRKLAREHHPDVSKTPGSDTRFKEISEAYEVLGDPQKRKRYDALGENWRAGENFDPSAYAGSAGGGGGGPWRGAGQGGGFRVNVGGGDFSDFFEQIFGGMGGAHRDPGEDPAAWASRMRGKRGGTRAGSGQRGRTATGSDEDETPQTRAEITLPLTEAALGSTRRLTLRDQDGRSRTVDVKIPKGTTDGSVIRLAGQGGGAGSPHAGDLLLEVRVAPDPRFTVSGLDLTTPVTLAPWEAALGAKVPVPTLEGEVTLTIPHGSNSGQRLRLRGKGIPGRGSAAGGDLFAEIRIAVPKSLNAEEKKLYEQLRDIASNPRAAEEE